ncbi:hypothetical protein MMC22_000630 [Lobaria immixta]|nr:hypothetical protein [Lobaria immixta]
MSSDPPNPPQSPQTQAIPTWRARRHWQPNRLPSGRVEYADAGITWELVDLTPEEHEREMARQQCQLEEERDQQSQQEQLQEEQDQQGQGQGQERPAWGVETPRVVSPSPADEWTGGLWDDGNAREDGDWPEHATGGDVVPLRAPTPFSGFDDSDTAAPQPENDDPGTEQVMSPTVALDATNNGEQLPAGTTGTAAEMAGSSEAEGEERGRQRAPRQRRVTAPPMEIPRRSRRRRIKTRRMIEGG